MHPILVVGQAQLATYSVIYSLAVIAAGLYAYHRLRRLPVSDGRLQLGLLLALGGAGAGLAASVLLPAVLAGSAAPDTPGAASVTDAGPPLGGASFLAALAGGSLAGALCAWAGCVPVGRAFDLGAPAWPLFLAIGRLGCLAAGCCWGVPTAGWPGLYLPDVHGHWAVRHPTQLYSAAANLAILAILLAVERWSCGPGAGTGRRAPARLGDGFLFLLYLLLISAQRFSEEWVRASALPWLGPLSAVHVVTLVTMAAAAAAMIFTQQRKTKTQNP